MNVRLASNISAACRVVVLVEAVKLIGVLVMPSGPLLIIFRIFCTLDCAVTTSIAVPVFKLVICLTAVWYGVANGLPSITLATTIFKY